jgi:hypothetical protein
MAAMRVAIAGTNSLAVLMAYRIQQETNYQFVMLSRFVSVSGATGRSRSVYTTPPIHG